MKNLKKLISVIIAVIMIVGSFATVSAADYKDVESTDSFYKAINVLSGLGIVNGDDEGNFNPKNDIKRSEMVALVCRAMGETDIATNSASNAFADVAANHWAAGYIAWGVNRGIVNGMGDGTFAPDASVSYQDAVVMIMRALGFDRIAQRAQNGGYPAGYLKLASQRGVLKDAGYDNQAAAPREVVAQLIYNAMTAPLVDVKQYGMNVEDDRYIIHDGSDEDAPLRTLLTYTNEIVKVKAEITKTAKTDSKLIDKDGNYKVDIKVVNGYGYTMDEISKLLRDEEMGKDEKAFALTDVYVGETEAADLLGATVEAYLVADEDLNDAWKLLAVVADAKSVKTETLKAAEVKFTKYEDKLFTYEDADGNEEEIDLVEKAKLMVYYNGKEVATADKFKGDYLNTLLKDAEELTFSGSKTSDYEKIFITDYEYMVVEKVYADEFIIASKGDELNLDTESKKDFAYNICDANGNKLAIEDIVKGNILNILAPKAVDLDNSKLGDLDDVKYMDIYVTNKIVTGSITESLMDGYRFAIDGTVYKTVDKNGVKVGDEGDFYITIDGRILKGDASRAVSKDFAFIVRSYNDTEYGSEKISYIGLYTANGEIKNYEVADKLTINGTVYADDADDVAEGKQPYSGEKLTTLVENIGKTVEAQAEEAVAQKNAAKRFVTYKLNSNNQIKELTFLAEDTTKAVYKKDFGTFGVDKFADDTKLFIAPVEKNTDGKYEVDKDDIKLGSFASMKDKDEYAAVVAKFDDAKAISAVLLNADLVSDYEGSHFAVVMSKGTGYDPETAEEITKYRLLQSGAEVTLNVSADAVNVDKTLEVGDVILYSVDAKGDIENMLAVYDASEKKANKDKYAYSKDKDFVIVYGEIEKIDDDYTYMSVKDSESIQALFGKGEGNTYASIDYTDGNFSEKDIKVLRGYEGLRYESSTKTYKVLSLYIEGEAFEDCIMIIDNK